MNSDGGVEGIGLYWVGSQVRISSDADVSLGLLLRVRLTYCVFRQCLKVQQGAGWCKFM